MKTYVFDVPVYMAVTVRAGSLQEAKDKVQRTIENKAVNIEADICEGYVTMGPDTGADFELLESWTEQP